MSQSTSETIVIQADQEHNGIRVLVLVSLAFAIWLSFLFIRAIVSVVSPDSEYILLLSCFGAIPLALPLVWAAEHGLKRIWPSGRQVRVDHEGLAVKDGGSGQYRLAWQDPLNQLGWYFRLSGYHRGGRERRVSAKWLCLCSQLQQGQHRLTIFAFFPPKRAAELLSDAKLGAMFQEIFPADVYDNSLRTKMGPPSRPSLPSALLAGKDGRYWLAERRRWEEGFELAAPDFERLMLETSTRLAAMPMER